MKKFLAMMLCMLLTVLSPIALADATLPAASDDSAATAAAPDGLQTLFSYSGLYTIGLPAYYLPINAATLAVINDIVSVEALTEAGMDEAGAQAIVDMITSIDYESTDFAFAPDMYGSINGIVTVGSGITTDMLAANIAALDAALTAQYVQLGAAEEDCLPMGMVTFGESDIQWYGFRLSFAGHDMRQFITCNDAGDQITLTMTSIPEDDIAAMMASFAFVAA